MNLQVLRVFGDRPPSPYSAIALTEDQRCILAGTAHGQLLGFAIDLTIAPPIF